MFISIFIFLNTTYKLIVKTFTKEESDKLNQSISYDTSVKSVINERLLRPLIKPLSKVILMNESKEELLKFNLSLAGVNLTPKEYYAKALIIALSFFPLAMFFKINGSNLLSMLIGFISVLIYFSEITSYRQTIKERRIDLEKALPQFVRSILYNLKNYENSDTVTVDIIKIFEEYYEVLNKTGEKSILKKDISILITEMKSINVEVGLRNFDNRLRMTHVTFLIQALIGVNKGEDQTVRIASLSNDMNVLARESLKRELDKKPEQIKRVLFPLAMIAIVTIFYVIGTHLTMSMGGLI